MKEPDTNFDPKCNIFPYPEHTDEHYLKIKMDRGIVFDENYPYLDESAKFKFKKLIIRFLLVTIVFPMTRIRLGLKIYGKNNLKKHKKELRSGVISVTNHVHLWDYLMLNVAIKPIKPYVLIWSKNINGENGNLMRLVGGIPLPDNNINGTAKLNETIEKILKNNGWIQIYAEGSMWEFYKPIRPLKTGSAYFAVKNNKPIIPMAYSYRKPSFIRRKIFHQIATFDLNIGEPIYPNQELSFSDAIIDLTKRTHESLCILSGVDPKNNIYQPIFKNDTRIDYYTTSYGKNQNK